MVLALIALALFIVSVFADRVLHAGRLAQWSFGLSFFVLMMTIEIFIQDMVLDMPPQELGFIDFMAWSAKEMGGWWAWLAMGWFVIAGACAIMYLPARFVDAVEPSILGWSLIFSSVIGAIFLIGIFAFLEKVALILGIVATIIGIIVGLKKL
ncbi:MAG: hypothetical protein JSW34_01595, partial [Candidatus Zixiibacteriota bacterium]